MTKRGRKNGQNINTFKPIKQTRIKRYNEQTQSLYEPKLL